LTTLLLSLCSDNVIDDISKKDMSESEICDKTTRDSYEI